MSNADDNWRLWGERDPYYAVLTDPRYRTTQIAETRAEFFLDGERFVTFALETWRRHFGELHSDTALDFGCGVGRLTIPLAKSFRSVVGVDVSPGMIAEAQRNSDGLAVEYRRCDDSLESVEHGFDFVITLMVLQHIPVTRGMNILARLLERINPGGGCVIHLPIRRRYSRADEWRYRLRHHVPGGQALLNILGRRPIDHPSMQMNPYPLANIVRLFHAKGFGDLLMQYGDHGRVDTATIFARRG